MAGHISKLGNLGRERIGLMSSIVGNQNLSEMWSWLAEHRGGHTFLEFHGKDGSRRDFTYAEFDAYINRVANLFLDAGVRQGENVGVQLYNSPEHIACCMACAKIGAVAVPINMQHTLAECAYVFGKCEISVLVAEPDCQCYYCAGVQSCVAGPAGGKPYEMPTLFIAHAKDCELFGQSRDFDAEVALQESDLRAHPALNASDTAMIIFTSGTTSDPKGVELTHANMLYGGYYGDWQCGISSDDRMLTTMPAFHSNFQTAALMPVLTAGATLVFVEKYSARRYWSQVREYRATALQLVAMMARTLLMQPEAEGEREHCVKSVQYYLAIEESEKDAFESRFGVRLQNCYGLTESVCWVTTDLPYGERRWPSVGRPGLGYDVRVVSEDGRKLEPGEVGDIVFRGTPGVSLMKGYYQDRAATEECLDCKGWMNSGDKGYFDEDGWLYFVDRKSNMIKRAGENISASEVEEVIASFPGIAEVAVIGVADSVRDQAVKAFLVFEPNAEPSVDAVIEHCRHNLADFKVPTIVEVVDALPRTSVGKCAKKLLR